MKNLMLLILLSLSLQGCASLAEMEARQLAYDGSGRNPCLWGGVTEKADAHCAEVRWGLQGYLIALNGRASQHLPTAVDAAPCVEHVQRLEQTLAARTDLHSERIYSCPNYAVDGTCHVSLVVTDARGERYVLDNGAVLKDSSSQEGVGSFETFVALTGGEYWMGKVADQAVMIASGAWR